MKKIYLISFLPLLACNKAPVADFSIEKSEYSIGQKVVITNKSENAATCKWTLPDGQNSTAFHINYTLKENTPAGFLSVTLECTSKDGKKKSTSTKKFTVL